MAGAGGSGANTTGIQNTQGGFSLQDGWRAQDGSTASSEYVFLCEHKHARRECQMCAHPKSLSSFLSVRARTSTRMLACIHKGDGLQSV